MQPVVGVVLAWLLTLCREFLGRPSWPAGCISICRRSGAGLWAAAQSLQMSRPDVACWLPAAAKVLPGHIGDESATHKSQICVACSCRRGAWQSKWTKGCFTGHSAYAALGSVPKPVWSSLQEGRLPGHIEEIKQHRLEKGEGRAAELSNLMADRSALMMLKHQFRKLHGCLWLNRLWSGSNGQGTTYGHCCCQASGFNTAAALACLLVCNWQVLTAHSLLPVEWQAHAWSHCSLWVSMSQHSIAWQLLAHVYPSSSTCTARSEVVSTNWGKKEKYAAELTPSWHILLPLSSDRSACRLAGSSHCPAGCQAIAQLCKLAC